MILAAGTDANAIAIITASVSALTVVTASIIAFVNLRPGRRKLGAEADKAVADVGFAGGSYVKDISDAASSLVIPLRNENDHLRKRVIELEVRVIDLEIKKQDLEHKLQYERDLIASSANGFDHRMKQMALGYQSEISVLKEEIARLEGLIGND